ncbi:MAG: hypothetical protein WHS44_04030 [Fimbriimonadales bacterium]|nr:MAG: hypothetical protein KatS3mg018_1735 [Fimbriimonadales bacterium]
MIAPRWWFDLKQYAERLQHYSDEDLLDIYFHIHPIRYQAHYLCVLRELRRRGLKPRAASRPFAGLRWDLPQWVGAWGMIARAPLLARLVFGLLTLLLSAALTAIGLAPVWSATLLMRYIDPFTALFLMMCLVWAWGLGAWLTYRAGARGGWSLLAALGSSATLWAFLYTRAFARIVHALHQPPGGGGGWGF